MEDTMLPSDKGNKLQRTEAFGFPVPLAVDLDGTLIRTDSLIESIMMLLKANPFFFVLLFVWLAKGRAYLKRQVARRVTLDISSLPYNLDVLNFLRNQHNRKRTLILATGADEHIALQIAEYLHVFDRIIASDGKINLTGERKKEDLVANFGVRGFDYLGNDKKDLAVWQASRRALVVGTKTFIDSVCARLPDVEKVFEVNAAGWRQWFRALRLHHWLKNMLIFLPLLASHRFY